MTTYARPLYPGIAQIQSCTVTMGHGITPTGFQIVIVPQPSNTVIEQGTFRLEYNDQVLDFPECRIDQASFQFDEAGQLIQLTILDRRWKWALARVTSEQAFGRISGEYNIRREDGTIRAIEGGQAPVWAENTERTPQQLATLLLEAAGETGFSVADLPNESRPYVNWDVSNPMAELADLCESLNCRVVLGPLDNRVKICRVNQGRLLPTDGLIRYGAQADYNATPDELCVITDYVRFQLDFELEAVGLDIDGSIKPIDELSYKPAGGWKDIDVYSNMGSLDDGVAIANLATRSVFRWYRVKVPFDAPIFGAVEKREQVILLGAQVYTENFDGVKQSRDAMVYGSYFVGSDAEPLNSLNQVKYLPDDIVEERKADDERLKQIVRSGFSIDSERAIVRFSQPIWRQIKDQDEANNDHWSPAFLRLRTSCYLRFSETGGIVRKQKFRKLSNATNPYTLDLRHDEVKPTVIAQYSNTMEPIQGVENANEVDLEINHILSDAAARYSAPQIPQSGVYGGWRFDVNLDGAIQAISWSMSANGVDPITRIGRNQDNGITSVPYRLLRTHQKNAQVQRAKLADEWKRKQQNELARAVGVK